MKYPILLIAVLACITGYAQSPIQNLKNGIDTAITNKTATHSVTPYAVGTQMKAIADTVNTYFTKKTDTLQYSRIYGTPAALPPNGGAGGSLAGSYPNPMLNSNSVGVTQINATSPTAGQVLSWNGTSLAWSSVSGVGVSVVGIAKHVYTMSSLGFVSDADLSFYPSTFGTDQTTAMQHLLDSQITYGAIDIICDVKISVTGLKIGSHTHIIGVNNGGFVLRTNSSANPPLFRNRDTVFGHTPIDSDIVFENLTLNGNGYNSGGTRNNQATDASGANGICAALAMYGVDHFIVKHCKILNSACYGIAANTIKYGLYEDCYLEQSLFSTLNTDGYHFDGASEHCSMVRCVAKHCADDAFALNAADIYYVGGSLTSSGNFYPTSANGSANDLKIIDCVIDSGQKYGIRMLTYGKYRMDNISIVRARGLVGTSYSCIIDNYDTTLGRGNFGTIIIDDYSVANLNTTGAYIPITDIFVACDVDNLIIKNYNISNMGLNRSALGTMRVPTLKIGSPQLAKIIIGSFTLDGYTCKDTTTALNTNHLYFGANVKLQNVLLNNIECRRTNDVLNTSGTKYNSTFFQVVATDSIENFNVTNSIFSGYGFIGQISGYIKTFNSTGIAVKKNPPIPYGFLYLYSGTGGRIDQLNLSGVTIDSSGNDAYLLPSGTIGFKTGDFYNGSTLVKKSGDTVTGNLTISGITKTSSFVEPVNYKLNTTYTTTGAEYVTTASATAGNTTTITLCSCTGVPQTVTNYNNGGIVNVVVGSNTYNLASGASITAYYNNGIFSILNGYGIPYNGTVTASGTGSATTISIPHGLSGITGASSLQLTPRNSASGSILYADVDGTNIYIYYSTAPASGTNNLKYSYVIKP